MQSGLRGRAAMAGQRRVSTSPPPSPPNTQRGGRVVVVGGVAGGATAAARARRTSELNKITLFEKGKYVSFANCGLPYFLGGDVTDREDLLLATPATFKEKYDIEVKTQHEVLKIDRDSRTVRVRDLQTKDEFDEPYDSLILAPGASALRPKSIPHVDSKNVFVLKTVPDADVVRALLDRTVEASAEAGRKPQAIVVGGGFIGLETAEAFHHRGCEVTIVEMAKNILPPFDSEMAEYVEHVLVKEGVNLQLGQAVCGFVPSDDDPTIASGVELKSGEVLPADIVVLSLGVSAETSLARDAGLEIGKTGGIVVDDEMHCRGARRIFACGDAVESKSRLTGLPGRFQLAGPAQKQGRVAGTNAALAALDDTEDCHVSEDEFHAGALKYPGALGTSIVDVFTAVAGCTGLNERACVEAGIKHRVIHTHPLSHVKYVPGAKFMHIKLIVEDPTCRILGAQIVGVQGGGVARRIDVIATAILGKLTCRSLEELDLSYSPFHGAANDAVAVAGFVAANLHRGEVSALSVAQYRERFSGEDAEDHFLVDVRPQDEFELGSMKRAVNIPLNELRDRLHEIPRDMPIVSLCRVGLTAYAATRALTGQGFKDVYLLSGGITTVQGRVHPDDVTECKIPTHNHLE